ncbi:hypothetical protein SADUNF_Sadunf09G0083200 [Salix dunnii]|uniref:Uncharacterized protein n=1 Tax=Salix dunnii TaxID=1413687 RepID=A0A835JSY9_9ROSI|nr:hypothetical protein SADUNF_Sadunf09G0083200 [Salix dunnii]
MDQRQADGIKIPTFYLNWFLGGSYSCEEFYVGKWLSQATGSEVKLRKIEVITRRTHDLLNLTIFTENPTCLVLAWYPDNLGSSLTLSTPELGNISWYGYPISSYQSYKISAFLEMFQLNFTRLPCTYLPDLSRKFSIMAHTRLFRKKIGHRTISNDKKNSIYIKRSYNEISKQRILERRSFCTKF